MRVDIRERLTTEMQKRCWDATYGTYDKVLEKRQHIIRERVRELNAKYGKRSGAV